MNQTAATLQRHSAQFPCPVCGGHAALPRGRGVRCAGFTLGGAVYCTREEHAGQLPWAAETDPPAFKHRRSGRCDCGDEHARFSRGGDVHGDAHEAAVVRGPRRESLPLEERHTLYSLLIDKLTLREGALFDLRRRGLSLQAINAVGYRSLPATIRARKDLLDVLVQHFGATRLRACPGFTDKNGRLSLRWGDDYLVPYRDEDARITGIQFKQLGGGYFTARGSVQRDLYHVGGRERLGGDLFLTEGGLKAEVAAQIGACAVMGVVGLTLSAEHVEAIGRMHPSRVIVAVDHEANPHSAAARQKWAARLHAAGFDVRIAVWEGADANGPKGLDDLFQARRRPRLRSFTAPPAGLETRRIPRETATRGPVAPGTTLVEARKTTGERIQRFLAGTRGSGGKALLVRSGPGVGKSYAVAALPRYTTARIVTGTLALAGELAQTYGYGLVIGRSESNCARIEVVRALEANGHDVARSACGTKEDPRCPVRAECPYWAQFDRSGPLVGATEQAFNPTFVRPATVLVFDDAELLRGMIERHLVSREMVIGAVELLARTRRKAARRLLTILQHGFVDPPEGVLIGAAVWDHLARVAAQQGEDLVRLVDALPMKPTLPEPADDADGYVSVQSVQDVPAGTLLRLLETLQEEQEAFAAGGDFNSRLRMSSTGITVSAVREHPRNARGEVLIQDAAVLVLDATPIPSLVDRLLGHHTRLPDIVADVRLPESVRVVQYASTSNGHGALKVRGGLTTVLGEIAAERTRVPVADRSQEAAIVYRDQRRALIDEGGFAPGQVLTFGSVRGTNTLAQVERLHVVGRPMPPTHEIAYVAQVIHHDGPPISDQLALVARPYGGQAYEIDVVDFVDPRPGELLWAQREDELLQDVHRARLATLPVQGGLFPSSDGQRTVVQVIVHTSHAIPGLRVDDLHFAVPRTSLNDARHAEAELRIRDAMMALAREGQTVSIAAVARRSGASRNTVRDYFVEGDHTLKKESIKGVISLPKMESEATAHSSTPSSLRAGPAMGLAPLGQPGVAVDDSLRQRLTDWAQAHGYPALRFRPGITVVATPEGWATFLQAASVADIEAALLAADSEGAA